MGIRVGIIGTGFGTIVHAPVLQRHPGFEVVSLSSIRPGRARTEAERLHIPFAFDNWRRMIKQVPMDLVVVASEPARHADMVIASLESGIDVLCEKPPALSVDEAMHMQEVANQRNRRLLINFEWRYLPERQKIKQILNEGLLGKVIHVNWTEAWGILDRIREEENTWDWQADKGGGMLGAVGSHMIDAINDWFGSLSMVQGLTVRQVHERRGTSGLEPSTAEDSFIFQGRFESGGTCSVQFIVTSVGLVPRIEILGTKGTLVLEGKCFKLASQMAEDFAVIEVDGGMDVSDFPASIQPYVHAQWTLYSLLSRAIHGEEQLALPTFADAIKVQSVMDTLRGL